MGKINEEFACLNLGYISSRMVNQIMGVNTYCKIICSGGGGGGG